MYQDFGLGSYSTGLTELCSMQIMPWNFGCTFEDLVIQVQCFSFGVAD